jgi:hypothetical protein
MTRPTPCKWHVLYTDKDGQFHNEEWTAATILRAAANQLRTWAEQMDDEASMITAADLSNEYHGRAPAKRRRGRRAYDVERAPELAHLEDSHATPPNP